MEKEKKKKKLVGGALFRRHMLLGYDPFKKETIKWR